ESSDTRDSVFERIPTDRVYVSNDQSLAMTAVSQARVALCYSASDELLPTKMIKAEDNGVERRGKRSGERIVHDVLPDSEPAAYGLLVVEV
ncbi:5-deoxy-glucuronate isomerase, partial [Bacillus atrophaeus]